MKKWVKVTWIRKNGEWITRIYYADGTFVFTKGAVLP